MPHDGHNFTEPPPDPALRVKALESLLVEKGLERFSFVGLWMAGQEFPED